MEFLHQTWDTIKPHISTAVLAATWLGIAFVAIRRRRDWKSKRFANQVNFSLNYLIDGKLAIRTLLETTASSVWLNEYGVKLVTVASTKTRPDQPFIVLKDPADMKFVKQAILNVLSEHFSQAFVAHVLHMPVRKTGFVFALTFENYPDMRTRKFRVLLVEEKTIAESFGPQVPESQVEEVNHKDRLQVLRTMSRLAANPGTLVEGADVLGHVELGVVA